MTLARAPQERARRFGELEPAFARRAFLALDPIHQCELLDALPDERMPELLEAMEPDDRARLLDELPPVLASRLLNAVSARERALTATVLGYPERTAGRIMSPELVPLYEQMTVTEALEAVRRDGGAAETVYTLPLRDGTGRLTGTVELLELVLAGPERRLDELVDRTFPAVSATTDQEAVGRLMQEADLVAVPVVDDAGVLLGIVTVDDAMEVLEAEDTEDLARAGGAEPLRRPYLTVPVARLVRSRIVWLTALVAAATLTVTVLSAFEETVAEVVTLALFIPLLIGTGGNAGAQAATTVTRALAMGRSASKTCGASFGGRRASGCSSAPRSAPSGLRRSG